jgi:hypothetical protein
MIKITPGKTTASKDINDVVIQKKLLPPKHNKPFRKDNRIKKKSDRESSARSTPDLDTGPAAGDYSRSKVCTLN